MIYGRAGVVTISPRPLRRISWTIAFASKSRRLYSINSTSNFLIFLSDDCFGRPFCQAEQRWGKLYGCNFVGVVEKDFRHNPADFGKEKERAPADLKHLLVAPRTRPSPCPGVLYVEPACHTRR